MYGMYKQSKNKQGYDKKYKKKLSKRGIVIILAKKGTRIRLLNLKWEYKDRSKNFPNDRNASSALT